MYFLCIINLLCLNVLHHVYVFVILRKRSELIIRSFNTSDAGRYECRAKNKVNRNIEHKAIVIRAYPGMFS